MMDELHQLFQRVIWHIPNGYYLRGPQIRALCTPCATNDATSFDVSLTIQSPRKNSGTSNDVAVVLYGMGDQAIIHYGRLNHRGQILFRSVQAGAYRPICSPFTVSDTTAWSVQPPLPLRERLATLLISTPDMQYRMVAMGAHTEHHWACHYQNASGTLTATIHAYKPGEFILDIEAPDRAWDRTLVGLIWVKQFADEDRTESHLLFAPLRWSTSFNACTAHLRLEGMIPTFSVALPDHAWPLDTLTTDLEPLLRQSIQQSATAHTHRAWLELAQSPSALPPEIRTLLSTILQT